MCGSGNCWVLHLTLVTFNTSCLAEVLFLGPAPVQRGSSTLPTTLLRKGSWASQVRGWGTDIMAWDHRAGKGPLSPWTPEPPVLNPARNWWRVVGLFWKKQGKEEKRQTQRSPKNLILDSEGGTQCRECRPLPNYTELGRYPTSQDSNPGSPAASRIFFSFLEGISIMRNLGEVLKCSTAHFTYHYIFFNKPILQPQYLISLHYWAPPKELKSTNNGFLNPAVWNYYKITDIKCVWVFVYHLGFNRAVENKHRNNSRKQLSRKGYGTS